MDGNGMEEPWGEGAETSVVREDSLLEEKAVIYDLEKRTAEFGEAVIDFLKRVAIGSEDQPPGRSDHRVRHEHRRELLRGRRCGVA
jgi:hypothetical protein